MDRNPLQPYVIGIDVGTGSTKAIAMDLRGTILAGSRVSYPTRERLPGYSEQDPELIWNAFADCIKKITETLPYPPASISLSSAMHGLMLVDQHHKPLTPLQTWSDTRSEKIAERLRKSEDAEKIYRATGTPLHAMSPLCKIIWLKENEPEIYSRAARFISIKEYIWHILFGAYQTDWSVASATGLFDLESFEWNDHCLRLCQIRSGQLSEIVSTSFTRKDPDPALAGRLHIPPETPFCIGASDGCLANAGSFAVAQGTAALTIGTSGAVRVASAAPVFNFGAMTFNYVLDETTFICGGPLNNGGSALDWALKTFSDHPEPSQKDYETAFSLIETVPAGCRGLLFLPYLNGERAPLWDERACGVFLGIKSFHTKAFFLRAVVEGICYAINQVLETVESSAENISRLHAGGGFIHSKTWMKMLSDISGKELCVNETEEASAVGAALIGMKALKMIKDYAALQPADPFRLQPDPGRKAVYEKYYQVFKKGYGLLMASMHTLHDISA